jgi:hypothetical protein
VPKALKIAAVVMTVLFVLGAAVQYNDPDPWRWVAIYASAAVASVLALRGKLPRWLAIMIAVIAAIWAATLAPCVVGYVRFSDLFREIGMDSPAIEEGREMVGLMLISAWMVVLALAGRRMRPSGGAGATKGEERVREDSP